MRKSAGIFRREDIICLEREKRIIGFGAGFVAMCTINLVGNVFDEFIDNDQQRWHTKFQGKNVTSLKDVLDRWDDRCFILICSERYDQIREQLNSYGLVAGKNFGYSPVIGDACAENKGNYFSNQRTSFKSIRHLGKRFRRVRRRERTIIDFKQNGLVDLVFSGSMSNFFSTERNADKKEPQLSGIIYDVGEEYHIIYLPTSVSLYNLVCDFDNDGNLDILFTNFYRNMPDGNISFYCPSIIYYGERRDDPDLPKDILKDDNYLPYVTRKDGIQVLPVEGANCATVMESRKIGAFDLVITSRARMDYMKQPGVGSEFTNAAIFFNTSSGYNPDAIADPVFLRGFMAPHTGIQALPSITSEMVKTADLNNNGNPDVIITQKWRPFDHTTSYATIYFGTETGYNPHRIPNIELATREHYIQKLPAHSNEALIIEDFTGNGFKDVFLGGFTPQLDSSRNTFAYIYFNSEQGLNPAEIQNTKEIDSFLRPTNAIQAIPTHYSLSAESADLNGNGFLDLVIANNSSGQSGRNNLSYSVIYFGTEEGFNPSGINIYADVKQEEKFLWPDRFIQILPSLYANCVKAIDLNRNGFMDIVFGLSLRLQWVVRPTGILVFWGSEKGWNPMGRDNRYVFENIGNFSQEDKISFIELPCQVSHISTYINDQ